MLSFTVSSTTVVRVDLTAGKAPSFFAQQPAQRLRVGSPHLGDAAVFTRDVMNLLHLRDLGELESGELLASRFVRSNEDEREQTVTKRLRVQLGVIPFDDPPLLQLSNPFEHSGGRHVDPPGYFGVRHLAFSCMISRISASIPSIILRKLSDTELSTRCSGGAATVSPR